MTMTDVVIPAELSKDHYRANACILWCFDDRFWKLRKKLIEERGFRHVDIVQVAGGAKSLAEDGTPAQKFLLDQIGASIRLHDTDLVIPTLHIDCGAMGGSKSFGGHEIEVSHHRTQLEKIEEAIKRHYPQVSIERFIPDFDGLHEA